MDWIDTKTKMPDSGVPVIVALLNEFGKPRRLRAHYAAPKTLPVGIECDDFGEYDEEQDEYFCPEGWYETNEYDEVHWFIPGDVTHWMPLPDFPAGYNV